jgi:hypothetical protein
MVCSSWAARLPSATWLLLLIGLGLMEGLGACRRAPPETRAIEPDAAARPVLRAASANRCGECHPSTEDEWRGSAHAHSASSPLYVAMRKTTRDTTCEACHSPLTAVLAPLDPVVPEGITCDVCHTIRDVTPGVPGQRFAMHLQDAVKYGPLCDAENHYFHRMGCSPLHEESRFCGACHQYRRITASGSDLPVYTEFDEWRSSPAAARGQTCQGCHMPTSWAPAAVGSPRKRLLPRHTWLGLNGRLRFRALRADAAIEVSADKIRVAVTMVNHGAGHSVPTGSPERRLILRTLLVDGQGTAHAEDARPYGRFLVDADGKPAPFFEASRVQRDNRLRAGEERIENLELPMNKAWRLRIEVLWRRCDPATTGRWLKDACDEQLLLAGEMALAGRSGRRTLHLRSPGAK